MTEKEEYDDYSIQTKTSVTPYNYSAFGKPPDALSLQNVLFSQTNVNRIPFQIRNLYLSPHYNR